MKKQEIKEEKDLISNDLIKDLNIIKDEISDVMSLVSVLSVFFNKDFSSDNKFFDYGVLNETILNKLNDTYTKISDVLDFKVKTKEQ